MSKPLSFESVQDYLLAEGFKIEGETFVKGAISIPAAEIIGHTPNTFAHKAREHGWVALVGDIIAPTSPMIWGTD